MMTNLFTGKGDTGTTTLFGCNGARVSKSDPIFEALGMLDELNTIVGWCVVACPSHFVAEDKPVATLLSDVQDHLFTIQAEVAGADKAVPLSHVEDMSDLIDAIGEKLPEIKTFLVPGGTELASRLDIARAVSRRVERRVIAIHESHERSTSEGSRAYLNRLSSFFFALGRLANQESRRAEYPPRYVDTQ
jgi:cob(I)alamin adenosyltransferase